MATQQTLILKLGALGDVLRTAALLHALDGQVTWVTSAKAAPLLADNPFIHRLYAIERLDHGPPRERFDQVINLEDEPAAARLASELNARERVGTFWDGDAIAYSESSREWFDMSLSSRFDKLEADRQKMANRKAYQELIFAMLGKRFEGQEYVLKAPADLSAVRGLVGLESRAGDAWPMKQWNQFSALVRELEAAGFTVTSFEQRPTLEQYIADIERCEYVVCGDTLAMHIALALKKQIVAIFTCTAPQEIYDYGRLTKVVSPLWTKYFYGREYNSEAADAIPLSRVLNAVLARAGKIPTEVN